MDDSPFQTLIAELKRDHPLQVGGGGLQAGEDKGDGAVDHGLASLRREVSYHFLLPSQDREKKN